MKMKPDEFDGTDYLIFSLLATSHEQSMARAHNVIQKMRENAYRFDELYHTCRCYDGHTFWEFAVPAHNESILKEIYNQLSADDYEHGDSRVVGMMERLGEACACPFENK